MSLRTAISVTPSSYTITEYVAPSDSGFWFCYVLGIYIVSVTYLMHMHAIYSGYHINQLCHNICHEHKYRSNNQLIPVHECDSRVKFRYWFYLKCLLLSMSPWWSVTFILRSGVVKVLPIWKIFRKANDAMHGCSVTRPFSYICAPVLVQVHALMSLTFSPWFMWMYFCSAQLKGFIRVQQEIILCLKNARITIIKDTLHSSKYVSINFDWYVRQCRSTVTGTTVIFRTASHVTFSNINGIPSCFTITKTTHYEACAYFSGCNLWQRHPKTIHMNHALHLVRGIPHRNIWNENHYYIFNATRACTRYQNNNIIWYPLHGLESF